MAWENGNSSSGGGSVSYEWASYTPTVSAWTAYETVGTAPTLTGTKTGYYSVLDKTLKIRFNYYQSSASTVGSGIYIFSIPSSYSIDTTIASRITDYSTATQISYPFDHWGTGFFGQSTTAIGVKVMVASASYLVLASGSYYISNSSFTLAYAPMNLYFTAEVPIT